MSETGIAPRSPAIEFLQGVSVPLGDRTRMDAFQLLLDLAACSLAIIAGVWIFWYLHWYIPRHDRLKLERQRYEVAAGIPPSPRDYRYAITFDCSGFTVDFLRASNRESIGMRWSEVCRAIAFKRDYFTVDCICPVLVRADGTGVEFNEEMAQ
jgi:hypothetical protein